MEEELETINKTGQAKNAFNIITVDGHWRPVLFTGKRYSHQRLHNLSLLTMSVWLRYS